MGKITFENLGSRDPRSAQFEENENGDPYIFVGALEYNDQLQSTVLTNNSEGDWAIAFDDDGFIDLQDPSSFYPVSEVEFTFGAPIDVLIGNFPQEANDRLFFSVSVQYFVLYENPNNGDIFQSTYYRPFGISEKEVRSDAADDQDYSIRSLTASVDNFLPPLSESFNVIDITIGGFERFLGSRTFIDNVHLTRSSDMGSIYQIQGFTPVLIEGSGQGNTFSFTITRNRTVAELVNVSWEVGPSAGPDSADQDDFGGQFPQGTVEFLPGEIVKTVTFTVEGDRYVEPDETFDVTLVSVTDGETGPLDRITGTIINDDAGVEIADRPVGIAEGDAGGTVFGFDVIRRGTTEGPITLDWVVRPVGANPANVSDFHLTGTQSGSTGYPSGQITIPDGVDRGTIEVPVAGDTDFEADETFLVEISSPDPSLQLGRSVATGTILNDDEDSKVFLSLLPSSLPEGDAVGDSTFTLTVGREGDLSERVDVYMMATGSVDSTDLARNVLGAFQATLSPDVAMTQLSIPIAGDREEELDETFSISIIATSGVTIDAERSSAQAIIRNDDNSEFLDLLTRFFSEEGRADKIADFATDLYEATLKSSENGTINDSIDSAKKAVDFFGKAFTALTVTLDVSAAIERIQISGDRLRENSGDLNSGYNPLVQSVIEVVDFLSAAVFTLAGAGVGLAGGPVGAVIGGGAPEDTTRSAKAEMCARVLQNFSWALTLPSMM